MDRKDGGLISKTQSKIQNFGVMQYTPLEVAIEDT
jgi:hypothetical protein